MNENGLEMAGENKNTGGCRSTPKISITEADVAASIVEEAYYTVGKKTTVCVLTLANGFEVTGTSACVCAKNYSEEIGAPYAKKKAMDQVWGFLAYNLQDQLAMEGAMKGLKECASRGAELMDPEPPQAA